MHSLLAIIITKMRKFVCVIAGKAGAIVGAFGFGQLFLSAGISTTLAILAATNFLGKPCPLKRASNIFAY